MIKRSEDGDTPNQLMDVRQKQILFKILRGYFWLA